MIHWAKDSHPILGWQKICVPLVGGLCLVSDFDQIWSKNAPLIGGCLTVDFDQMWSKMCPSSKDFVSSWTSTKCGPILHTSLEDFVTLRTWDRIWPMMRPSLEDFVTSWTFCSNGSRQRNIQVETNSLFDCLWPLKEGVPIAKSACNLSIPKKMTQVMPMQTYWQMMRNAHANHIQTEQHHDTM